MSKVRKNSKTSLLNLSWHRLRTWVLFHQQATYLLILLAIGIFSHLIWFTPGNTLFNNDWLHRPADINSQAWQMGGAWKNFFNLGAPNVQIGYSLVTVLWPIIGFFGGSFDAAVKVTMMIPIAILGFTAPYLAMRRFIENDFICFVSALFYGTTTYFLLLQTVQLPIAFVYALAPLIFYLFANALESMKIKSWVFFAVAYTVGLCYEVRIMYIVSFILGLYFVLSFGSLNVRKLPRALLITALILLGLNAFWVAPMLMGGAGSSITDLTSGGLFGNWLFDLPHAFALSASAWTGGRTSGGFVLEPIKLYFWLIPIVAFIPLAVGSKHIAYKHRQVLFFLVTALVGIFLTKQVLDPLPQAYPWLYAHLPGFSLFREASKFYLLTAWGYMGLIGFGLFIISKMRRKVYVTASVALIIVASLNLLPLVTGKIETLFKSRTAPADYTVLNDYISKEPAMSRVMWVPTYSQWSYFDTTHPRVSASAVMQQNLSAVVDQTGKSSSQKLRAMFSDPLTEQLLQKASINLLVVPLRETVNDDNFFALYGNNRQSYIDMLDSVSWLQRVNIGTKDAAVYKTKNANPHIDAATNLLTFPSFNNMQQLYEFNSTTLKSDFNFTKTDEDQKAPSTTVSDVFNDLNVSNVHKGGLSVTLPVVGKDADLYINANKPDVGYIVNGTSVELSAHQQGSIVLNKQSISPAPTAPQSLGSTNYDKNRNYFLAASKDVTPLDFAKDQQRDFGVAETAPRLVSTDNSNLFNNPSLERGLWQQHVDDCDPYDALPVITMKLSGFEYSSGKQSLNLNALAHNACTGPSPVPVKPGQEYLLSFDYKIYKASTGDVIGYQVIFNDPKHTSVKEFPSVENSSWHTERQLVTVPKDATTLTLKLISVPRSQSVESTDTYFDNVKLSELRTDLSAQLNVSPSYTTTRLTKSQNTVEYADPGYTGQNLVSNPSLEEGLWQKTVDDCNAYDDKPDITMRISHNAYEGNNSLELGAKRHIACTSTLKMPVKENTNYLISFAHESPNAKTASYSLNIDNPDRTSISGTTLSGKKWQTFSRIIKTPVGAKNLTISVMANANSAGKTYTINRYDDFKLIEIPNALDKVYLVDGSNAPVGKLQPPQKVDYKLISPTKKLVHVNGAKSSFYLTMSEAYDAHWKLALDDSNFGLSWLPFTNPKVVVQTDHIKWDGFMNGWYVDVEVLCKQSSACTKNSDGSYDLDLVIEYSAQRWFYLGSIVSGLTLLGCVAFLALTWRREPDKLIYRKGKAKP